jgi:hypothetical protein
MAGRWAIIGVVSLTLLSTACLPDAQRTQSTQLLERLTQARSAFTAQQDADDACTSVGDVQTRLFGEPGLVEVRPAWAALRDAAWALQSACGQTTALAQTTSPAASSEAARARWQQGIQRELSVACDHLRDAADALTKPRSC